ncbi:MAG: hypothetical protein VX275_14685, partial [Pseudomonadota bacterium]|nr:hypothetical protein [Pseudomonadota bacterium]
HERDANPHTLEEATFYNDLSQTLEKPGYYSRTLPATGTRPGSPPGAVRLGYQRGCYQLLAGALTHRPRLQ